MPMLFDALELSIPVFQAPMAGISTPELAAAVSNGGGLGGLGLGAMSWVEAMETVSSFRQRAKGALHVNFFCHDEPVRDPHKEARWIQHFAHAFDTLNGPIPTALTAPYNSVKNDNRLIEFARHARPNVISFHFGFPNQRIVDKLSALGIPLLTSVTNVTDARAAIAAGMDGLIAQGIEAGGHRGSFNADAQDTLATDALVRELTALTTLPIIASGGVMNGWEIDTMLRAGAQATQLGTAFLLCNETHSSPDYRRQLRNARATDTVITRSISGRPARGIANHLSAIGDTTDSIYRPHYPIAYDLAKTLSHLADRRGASGWGAYWAGTGVERIRDLSANALMSTLAKELKEASKQGRKGDNGVI